MATIISLSNSIYRKNKFNFHVTWKRNANTEFLSCLEHTAAQTGFISVIDLRSIF